MNAAIPLRQMKRVKARGMDNLCDRLHLGGRRRRLPESLPSPLELAKKDRIEIQELADKVYRNPLPRLFVFQSKNAKQLRAHSESSSRIETQESEYSAFSGSEEPNEETSSDDYSSDSSEFSDPSSAVEALKSSVQEETLWSQVSSGNISNLLDALSAVQRYARASASFASEAKNSGCVEAIISALTSCLGAPRQYRDDDESFPIVKRLVIASLGCLESVMKDVEENVVAFEAAGGMELLRSAVETFGTSNEFWNVASGLVYCISIQYPLLVLEHSIFEDAIVALSNFRDSLQVVEKMCGALYETSSFGGDEKIQQLRERSRQSGTPELDVILTLSASMKIFFDRPGTRLLICCALLAIVQRNASNAKHISALGKKKVKMVRRAVKASSGNALIKQLISKSAFRVSSQIDPAVTSTASRAIEMSLGPVPSIVSQFAMARRILPSKYGGKGLHLHAARKCRLAARKKNKTLLGKSASLLKKNEAATRKAVQYSRLLFPPKSASRLSTWTRTVNKPLIHDATLPSRRNESHSRRKQIEHLESSLSATRGANLDIEVGIEKMKIGDSALPSPYEAAGRKIYQRKSKPAKSACIQKRTRPMSGAPVRSARLLQRRQEGVISSKPKRPMSAVPYANEARNMPSLDHVSFKEKLQRMINAATKFAKNERLPVRHGAPRIIPKSAKARQKTPMPSVHVKVSRLTDLSHISIKSAHSSFLSIGDEEGFHWSVDSDGVENVFVD